MIFPVKDDVYSHNEEAEPLIVPLAVILLAGPSAIAAVILMMVQERSLSGLRASIDCCLDYGWCDIGFIRNT